MNKRIRKKQRRSNFITVKVPRDWSVPSPTLIVVEPTYTRRFTYTSIDLSSPERRRAAFKGIVHEWEHRRVEAALRRVQRRRSRRFLRAARWRMDGDQIWAEFPNGVPAGWRGTLTIHADGVAF